MTDDPIESRLRLYRVAGPTADLRRRVLAGSHQTLSDVAIGWVIAAGVAACLCLSAWRAEGEMQRRIEVLLEDPEVAVRVTEASAILGEEGGRALALALLANRADESANVDAAAPGEHGSW